MGMALEIVGAKVTMASTAAEAAMSASTGDSLTVRSFETVNPAYLLNFGGYQATAGYTEVKSPRMHDNVRGIRARILATTPDAQLCEYAMQPLYPSDVLGVYNIGGNSEVDSAFLLLFYQDAPGMAARLATWEQVKPRIVNLASSECLMTAPGVAGDWGAGVSLSDSSTGDLLKADTDYAILGYLTDTVCTAVGIKGPDTGNVRVGGPGYIDPRHTRNWFVQTALFTGLPTIPIVNANNKGSTNVAQLFNAASGTPHIDLLTAELRPGG